MGSVRAAVLEADGSLAVSRIEVEEPREHEVLVRVTDCGVCHSDLSLIDGDLPTERPVVLGHEAAGVVEAVGPGVTAVRVGDPVVITPLPSCGRCALCLRGNPTLCLVHSSGLYTATRDDGTTPLGRDGAPVLRGLGVGGWSERVVVPAIAVVKVGDDTDLAEACVIGCAVQTGVGAVINTAGVEPGATVAVLGAGGIGIACVQGARIAGAAVIVAVDPVAERREAALSFGATHAVDPADTDVASACLELTGIGVDYAFEAAGVAALIEQGLAITRPGGTTVCVGAPPADQGISIPMAVGFMFAEKRLVGSLLGSMHAHRDIPRLLALARAGRLELGRMVTDRYALDDIAGAVDNLRQRRGIRTAVTVADRT
jgi:Zn-dependent alcohol dehydrogenase